jgi:hypothetical protein
MKTLILAALAVLLLHPHVSLAQEPSAPAPPPASPAQPSAGEPSATNPGSSSSKTKSRVVPSFLIIGTVFDERALALPGAQVRIRKSSEKKFRWQASTDSRGEFAVRVPPGEEYEVVIHANKKYEDATQAVDGKVDVQQRLSIKMQPKGQEKTGGKS